jgi:hypothetical protein
MTALGSEGFLTAARAQLRRFGGQRLSRTVADRFFAALVDRAGVATQRRGGLERVGFLLDDWCHTTS